MDGRLASELALSLAIGIGLSAACGFRVFVPFTVMSAAHMAGYLSLADNWAWIGTWPALAAFGTATILEIGAYYLPWLDNFLDTIATPAAVIAGGIASAAMISGMSPMLTWSLAVIAGGGAAGIVQTATVLVRSLSSVTTLGLGNFAVATGEWMGALITTLLAILLPFATAVAVIVVAVWTLQRLARVRRRTAQL